MPLEKEIDEYLDSQQSIQFYDKVKTAFKVVFNAMTDEEFREATDNLILMVLHEGAMAQVMHFPKSDSFKVLQLSVAKQVPHEALCYIIAHELGHVLQGRNWNESDEDKLETDADKRAEKWGFVKTEKVAKFYNYYCSKFKS